ncbi:hypothetical protein [Enterococcus hirae]|nr:hypothetical protein [Enterococcus hirae]MCR1913597.1 hypothetical protein [Enterococcus hirae]MDL4889296.1 hypothetical protein [Enterococcus hirae]MDL4891910.1 hypothetical protein [Enterococcus hirae]MDL4898047.1 hypothetical protein [Enterococcus hirae]MDL4900643.1 hypothetical protein [Enterococcus hirae]
MKKVYQKCLWISYITVRYGIGKLSLDGRNIPQNKPYIGWKSFD